MRARPATISGRDQPTTGGKNHPPAGAANNAYEHREVRDDYKGGAATQRRQGQIYDEYRKDLHTQDKKYFDTGETDTGPLETILRQGDFHGLAFGTYGEISSNVRKLVSMATEYGHKHLAKTIMAKDLDAAKATIRRRFHARIAMASWRGYANMLLGRVQYVGKSRVLNKIQRQVRLVEQVDMGTLGSWSCAHLVDRPLPIICPKGWVF